ncbi:site-specific integrase [Maribrevibacterium harenarium]|uniref:Site-specific integrase n=1 Tax=Maribrevibacterium harenarium TaxID=2589817 RepID=A0A501X584_9GAMM|nr:site-specific integrase [Maribrevibacterium harenarium]TPE55644.1 site-specific integrase [Maribrevibacterium harenarium]
MAPYPLIDNLEHLANPFTQFERIHSALVGGEPKLQNPDFRRDLQLALCFIYSYNGSQATFNSYRREVERLLLWAWHVKDSPASHLRRDEIEEFIHFCVSPPEDWIGTKNVARFKSHMGERVPNDEWRPFVAHVSKLAFRNGEAPLSQHYNLSQAAIRATFSILSSFYGFLMQEEAVQQNPVALIRQKSKFIKKEVTRRQVRRISNLQWDYVIETAELLAEEDPATHERTLFIMNALLGMYLRISELVADERSAPVMGDFIKDTDGHWWFKVLSKGNKERLVSVSDEMLDALVRYRRFRQLPDLPTVAETTALIPKNRGQGAMTSSRQIRNIVQFCFDQAYERMCSDGMKSDAEDLRVATVHWLRHTGISEDVKVRPKEHVREDAGHASMATTDRYIDTEYRERHASARKKPLRPH